MSENMNENAKYIYSFLEIKVGQVILFVHY